MKLEIIELDTEGGPFVLLPKGSSKHWEGVFGKGYCGQNNFDSDYEMVCHDTAGVRLQHCADGRNLVSIFSESLWVSCFSKDNVLYILESYVDDNPEEFIEYFLSGLLKNLFDDLIDRRLKLAPVFASVCLFDATYKFDSVTSTKGKLFEYDRPSKTGDGRVDFYSYNFFKQSKITAGIVWALK